jgi:AraC-like DNA-binding protein
LRLIHQRPAHPWTVDSLAAGVAMSRSAFAHRFRHLVGVPPLSYVTRWRMHKASGMLRNGDVTIASVARAVGYETESSFGKLFKRSTGHTPGEFRAKAQEDR